MQRVSIDISNKILSQSIIALKKKTHTAKYY